MAPSPEGDRVVVIRPDYIEVFVPGVGRPTWGVALLSREDEDLVYFRWHLQCKGYASRMTRAAGKNMRLYLHRVVMERASGRKIRCDRAVHHENGDRLDCRRQNLRVVTWRTNNLAVYAYGGKSAYQSSFPEIPRTIVPPASFLERAARLEIPA